MSRFSQALLCLIGTIAATAYVTMVAGSVDSLDRLHHSAMELVIGLTVIEALGLHLLRPVAEQGHKEGNWIAYLHAFDVAFYGILILLCLLLLAIDLLQPVDMVWRDLGVLFYVLVLGGVRLRAQRRSRT